MERYYKLAGPSGQIHVECSPDMLEMMESNPEILEVTLSQVGLLDEGNFIGEHNEENELLVPITEASFGDFLTIGTQESMPQPSPTVTKPATLQPQLLIHQIFATDTLNGDCKLVRWLDAQVKLLLSLVEELRPKAGSCAKLGSKKKMCTEIGRHSGEKGYKITAGK